LAKWQKGQSGNPAGKPPAIHSHHTTQVKELIASRLPELVEKAIGMALDGDAAAMKICLERVCPPMRPRDDPVRLDMPAEANLASLGRRILEGMPNARSSVQAAIVASGVIFDRERRSV
jgi:Family of unknown function (DUF5681)